MNTLQLKRALEHNPSTQKDLWWSICFDLNYLRHVDTFPYGFVANTDPSTELERIG